LTLREVVDEADGARPAIIARTRSRCRRRSPPDG
jgi:hypothetical protein